MQGLWKSKQPIYDKYGNKTSRYSKNKFRRDKFVAQLDIKNLTQKSHEKVFNSKKVIPLDELTVGYFKTHNDEFGNEYVKTDKFFEIQESKTVTLKYGKFSRRTNIDLNQDKIFKFYKKNCKSCPLFWTNINHDKNNQLPYHERIKPCTSIENLYYYPEYVKGHYKNQFCERKNTDIFNVLEKFTEPFYIHNEIYYNFYTDEAIKHLSLDKVLSEHPNITKIIKFKTEFYNSDDTEIIEESLENDTVFYGQKIILFKDRNDNHTKEDNKIAHRKHRAWESRNLHKIKYDNHFEFPGNGKSFFKMDLNY